MSKGREGGRKINGMGEEGGGKEGVKGGGVGKEMVWGKREGVMKGE